MEWERGEATPGRVMANLKTAGLRDLLEALAAQAQALKAASVGSAEAEPSAEPSEDAPAADAEVEEPAAWTPTV
jgi:hypothetical protein